MARRFCFCIDLYCREKYIYIPLWHVIRHPSHKHVNWHPSLATYLRLRPCKSHNTTLSTLLDKHAPVITKFSSRKSKSNPWFTSALRSFKSKVRHAENIWKRTHSVLDWSSFKSLRNRYHNLILASKKQYYSNLVSSSSDNPRHLWQTINNLLHRKSHGRRHGGSRVGKRPPWKKSGWA